MSETKLDKAADKIEEEVDRVAGQIGEKLSFVKGEAGSVFERVKASFLKRSGNILAMATSRKNIMAVCAIAYIGATNWKAVLFIVGLTMILNTLEKRAYIKRDTETAAESRAGLTSKVLDFLKV